MNGCQCVNHSLLLLLNIQNNSIPEAIPESNRQNNEGPTKERLSRHVYFLLAD
jgi:hypothetical protein